MSTQDILDAIDAACDDWAVGPDAVRYNAPPEVERVVDISHYRGDVPWSDPRANPLEDLREAWLNRRPPSEVSQMAVIEYVTAGLRVRVVGYLAPVSSS